MTIQESLFGGAPEFEGTGTPAQVAVLGSLHLDIIVHASDRPKKGETLTVDEIMQHCRGIASYKRPQHVEIWPENKDFPLTRVAKVDKKELIIVAEQIVEELRKAGQWDAG